MSNKNIFFQIPTIKIPFIENCIIIEIKKNSTELYLHFYVFLLIDCYLLVSNFNFLNIYIKELNFRRINWICSFYLISQTFPIWPFILMMCFQFILFRVQTLLIQNLYIKKKNCQRSSTCWRLYEWNSEYNNIIKPELE